MFAFFKNASLLKQLIIPLVMVGVFGLGTILISAYSLEHSVVSLGRMYLEGGERLRSLQEIDKAIANLRVLSLKHLTSESAEEMRRVDNDLIELKQVIESNLAEIGDQNGGAPGAIPDEAALLGQTFAKYVAGIEQATKLSGDFEKERAYGLLFEAESRHLRTLQEVVQVLTRHAFDDISASREALLASAQRNLQMTIAIGILGGGLLLGVAFFVSRRTSGRLADLLAWSRRIAAGDLHDPLVTRAPDEVGQLTQAMERMVASLAASRLALETAKHGAEATAEELRLYANAFENSGEAMLITDRENRILNVNAAFTRLTGYPLDEIRGRNPKILSGGRTSVATYREMWQSLETYDYWQGELWDRKKTGETYPKWISISSIRDESGAVMFYVASFSDISERKANEARIDYLAHHDPLTGLINRYNLENRLGQVLLSAHRDGLRTAVLFIDMDRFKTINDTLGHHVGDLLLIEVARRLRECVRESDIVARLGGDEFVVVLTGMTEDMDAAPVADKILRALGQTYAIDGQVLHSSPSIGVAIAPVDSHDGVELMRNADTAMYHAKSRGRNNVQFFAEAMNIAASERLAMENDLRLALQRGELQLHYQPQIRVSENRVSGVEALVRWRHPQLGDIPPLKFIPIAEEAGLIETLGAWVLEEACRQLSVWRAEGIDHVRVAVNLSAKQLRSQELAHNVALLLRKYRLAGVDLELEITESAAMENPDRAIDQLQALRDIGVQLAIDDFGTGYSSLAYLKRLPIHVLKLDRTFVRDIEADQSDADISAATLALAHNLGLKVVAEGVETEAQRDFLVRHRCDYLQGYLYSKPLPADEATQFILRY